MRKVKHFLYLSVAAIVCLATATYGRWEYLTWSKGQEFIEPFKKAREKSEFNPGVPNFLRVINYSTHRAQVFTKEGRNRNYGVF
jgi:hypothetical protein